ncbi:MAG: hypothetical protein QW597_03775 [Thermoplasmataceae archaeon]
MIIDRFNNILDKQCLISFTNDYQLFEISRKFSISAAAKVMVDKEGPAIFFYMEKGAERYREVKIFLESLNARDLPGNWVVSSSKDRYEELNLLFEIVKIPSVIIDHVFLHNGYVSMGIRFHSAFSSQVSSILGKYLGMFPGMNILKLGPAPSLIDVLRGISEFVPLSIVGTLNVLERETFEENPLGLRWIRELKFASSDGLVHAVYKCDNPKVKDSNKVTVISEKDGIYEVTTRDDLVNFYADKTNSDMVSSFSRTQLSDGNTTIANSLFHRSYLRNFLEIINESRERFEKLKVTLLEVYNFPEDLNIPD